MRDIALLRFTLRAMRELGNNEARLVRVTRNHHAWYAGPQPLNGQAVQDLIADGWVKRLDNGRTLTIDAWPLFAGPAPEERQTG